MAKEIVVMPQQAADNKANFYASTGLIGYQVEQMRLGTWAACQAYAELGGEVPEDDTIGYALSVFDEHDPARHFVGTAVLEARWGDLGVIVSDSTWQARQQLLTSVATAIGQLANTRQGEI